MSWTEMYQKIEAGSGFIAALDQSGGSTPKALALYGVNSEAYSNEAEMYDLIHDMRTRIAVSNSFTGQDVVGAILFEMTMDREFAGRPAAQYLWQEKGVVPFLKVDKGLLESQNGVKLMAEIPNLNATLEKAKNAGVFGTKMRSVIDEPNAEGIRQIVDQQFEIAKQILSAGLMPIVEPEITISMENKAEAEDMLLAAITQKLDDLNEDQRVMLKLTLPEANNHYASLIAHPKILKVVALSGGYDKNEANQRLSKNEGMIASFSRALTENLRIDLSEDEFEKALGSTIHSIASASRT